MEYKTFFGRDYKEARQNMIRELGSNAYIYQINDVVRSRFFGLRKEVFCEIRAGKSSQSLRKKSRLHRAVEPTLLNYSPEEKDDAEVVLHSAFGATLNQPYMQSRYKKLNRLQEELEKRSAESARLRARSKPNDDVQLQQEPQLSSVREASLSPNQEVVVDFLIERDFRRDFAVDLAHQMPNLNLQKTNAKEDLALLISNQFRYSGNAKSSQMAAPNLLFFVGPTGVGKTTTLSKMASQFVLKQKKKIVMATFDTRRIMATAQLEKYAHILQIDFRVLRKRDDFKGLLTTFSKKDMVFIDTAGTSQRDQSHLDELGGFIKYLNCPKEVYLCLNASFRYNDLKTIADAFATTQFDRLLITKADESYSLGSVLSLAKSEDAPLSFLTYGQEVPQDIELLNEEAIKKRLLREWSEAR